MESTAYTTMFNSDNNYLKVNMLSMMKFYKVAHYINFVSQGLLYTLFSMKRWFLDILENKKIWKIIQNEKCSEQILLLRKLVAKKHIMRQNYNNYF